MRNPSRWISPPRLAIAPLPQPPPKSPVPALTTTNPASAKATSQRRNPIYTPMPCKG
ncbi:hypothetical protein LguiB_007537 [Lonicera macranthoides]